MIIAISTVALLHLHTGYMFGGNSLFSLRAVISILLFYMYCTQFFSNILSNVKESSIKSIS